MNKLIVIINVIRNIIGLFLVFVGAVSIFSNDVYISIFAILWGISLTHLFYKKMKIKRKSIQFIIPIIILLAFSIIASRSSDKDIKNNKYNESNINISENKEIEEDQPVEVTNLKFDEEEIEMDLKEEKEIQLIIMPAEANIENLEYCSSDENIAVLISKNTDDKTLIIKPISEGTCEIFVRENRRNRK